MSIQAVSWVLDHSQASGGERLVLIAIANHYDFNDPALPVLASEARLSRSAVIRAIKRLEDDGELIVKRDEKRGRSRKNHYTIPGYETSRNATIPEQPPLVMVASDGEMVASEAGNGRVDATRTVVNRLQPGGAAPDGAPGEAINELVAGYVDDYRTERQGNDPPRNFRAACGRAVKTAIADGVSRDDIARCLGVIAHEGKNPSTLPHVLGDYWAKRPRRMR
jgi:hypothetical protein